MLALLLGGVFDYSVVYQLCFKHPEFIVPIAVC